MIGQDGGQSIAIGEGRVLFVFSDTLLSQEAADGSRRRKLVFRANSAGFAPSGAPGKAPVKYFADDEGLPRTILRPTPIEKNRALRFWPLHGLLLEDNIYLYYLGVRAIDATTWGFRPLGVGLAVFDPRAGTCERFRWRDDWRLWKLGEHTLFGVQVLRYGGYVYLYGSSRKTFSHCSHIARVPIGDIDKPEAYETLLKPTSSGASPPDLDASSP